MTRGSWLLILVGFFVFSSAAIVSAQTPPDVVHTNDGGIYRGTILEFVPGDHLSLLMPSGEIRRFDGASVASAGAADPSTAIVPPPPPQAVAEDHSSRGSYPANPTSVRLRVTSSSPGVTLMRRSTVGTGRVGNVTAYVAQFDRLCTAPCEIDLDRGNHQFVVENQRGTQRAARGMTLIESDGTLDIGIESRRPQRVRRWVATIVLMAAAGALVAEGFAHKQCDSYGIVCDVDWAFMGPGVALSAAAYGMMMGAIFARDRGRVDFRPAN